MYQIPAPTVTLCGSTKFNDEFNYWNYRLSISGCCVFSVGLFGHHLKDFKWNSNLKKTLDIVHRQKIRMSDNIFVLNVNNYIGTSTWEEILYAIALHKNIYFLNPLDASCSKYLLELVVKEYSCGNDAFLTQPFPLLVSISLENKLLSIDYNFINLFSELIRMLGKNVVSEFEPFNLILEAKRQIFYCGKFVKYASTTN